MNFRITPLSLIQILLAALLCLGSGFAHAQPLKPINLAQYLFRLNKLSHSTLDSKTISTKLINRVGTCQIDQVSFLSLDPKTNQSHQVQIGVYHPVVSGQYPAVLISPTVFENTLYEEALAYSFCQKNFLAVIASVEHQQIPQVLPDWELHDQLNRTAIIDLKNILDFVENHSQVDPNKIIAFGTSLGAFNMALLSTIDSRIKASVIVAGAGNLPAIFSYGQAGYPAQLRELRMTSLKDHSVLNYENELRSQVNFDPILMARDLDSSKYFMLINLDDTVIPAENQLELWKAFGSPEHLDVHASHEETILGVLGAHFDEILKNIEKRIK